VSRKITYCEAINEGIIQEMKQDPSVFIYGIGVTDHKRVFGTTNNIKELFGEERCFDTPLSESALTGFALGAAINGMKPIFVHARVDFSLLSINQLVNMISSYRYTSSGKCDVPIVIRLVVGRGWGQAAQHSKSLHSLFAHIPGLKVVMPTTPYDAKGMMISAIRDNNPVIFIEHRWLYYAEDEVPEESYEVDINKSQILRHGDDITIVSSSWMTIESIRASDILKKHGIGVEVIDLRTATYFDEKLIIDSVKKTKNSIVADNDWVYCGLSAEVAAQIYEKCFDFLESPIERVGFAFAPCPSSRPLENLFYPNAETIIRLIEKKMGLDPISIDKEDLYSYENKFKGPF